MKFKIINDGGLQVFYREAGISSQPNLLLLHGFPSASHMFRNLMPLLEEHFHIIAPDYIGFGQSEAPDRCDFDYTFDHLTDYVELLLQRLQIDRFYMYVFDYGAPIGFRLALKHPEQILGIVSQNGNVYEEGLGKKWAERKDYWQHPTKTKREYFKSAFAKETIIGQYMTGERADAIALDGYSLDIFYSQGAGYAERQSDLIYDYWTNVALYPRFQQYLRAYQPHLLAVWGKNDPSFIALGARAFTRDVPQAKVHLLDAGHFALESHVREIADMIIKWVN